MEALSSLRGEEMWYMVGGSLQSALASNFSPTSHISELSFLNLKGRLALSS